MNMQLSITEAMVRVRIERAKALVKELEVEEREARALHLRGKMMANTPAARALQSDKGAVMAANIMKKTGQANARIARAHNRLKSAIKGTTQQNADELEFSNPLGDEENFDDPFTTIDSRLAELKLVDNATDAAAPSVET